MKIRSGFVANSSSSSFIIFGDSIDINWDYDQTTYYIGDEGKTTFGWENEQTFGVFSKINFAAMQAMYVKNEEWMNMLEEVIIEHLNCSNVENLITFDYPCPKGKVEGYIDHQSASCEGENIEIFESKEKLKLFLFCSNSYIQGGNDNS